MTKRSNTTKVDEVRSSQGSRDSPYDEVTGQYRLMNGRCIVDTGLSQKIQRRPITATNDKNIPQAEGACSFALCEEKTERRQHRWIKP